MPNPNAMRQESPGEGLCSTVAAGLPGSVLLERAPSPQQPGRSLLFCNPVEIIETREPAQVPDCLDVADHALAQGLFVAGYIAYEAGFALEPRLSSLCCTAPAGEPLVWFGCYSRPETCAAASDARTYSTPAPRAQPLPSLDRDEYMRQVETVRRWIAAGETYQANLTLEMQWRTEDDPSALYERLRAVQPVPYAALLHPHPGWHILSLSPELFFARDGERIVTRPMKGTAPRGMNLSEMRANAAWLNADAKNRAENVMIVDLLRNDLGRLCRTGSVQVAELFHVERYPTVLQMTSTIEGLLRSEVRYAELFRALFPSGSIVGAPKIHTMRLLHGLEQRVRGIYTGAIGYMAPDNTAEFSVGIRTVSLRSGVARLGVGAGIVYDSQPAQEYDECRTKAAFITHTPPSDLALIETLRLQRGTYAFMAEHMNRMAESAEYFDIRFNDAQLYEALEAAARAHAGDECTRVRLLLHRNGAVSWTASPLATIDAAPAGLLLRSERVDSEDLYLRHKTTRRALYDEALRDAQKLGYADALFCNQREEITECAIHNVIVVLAGGWYTPPGSSGLLPGVYRRQLLEQGRITERVVRLAELDHAEAIYVCNSVRGLQRIRHIRERDTDACTALWSEPHTVHPRGGRSESAPA